ncbi:MAG: 2-succinyl-6-hydroxy-2,4-cyclohexadiene-1-carboxylate synthase [Anaerolinea sp.]|nr:2-succinyl-6-hydroxy-2,4-cyclohexadiene-1-carboxylate synthase [Anaerolinea sp.]
MRLQDGYAVNVEVSGDGPALVLLHGFTGSARSWGEFGVLLAERFTVVALDLAGHGQTGSPADLHRYTMAQCVDDTVAAVRLAGFESAHWLGYSMGGRTALHVAATHPETVRSLSLIGASPGLDCVEDRVARRSADELLAARIEREGVEAFVDYWENIPLFATQRGLPEATRARIREGRLRNTTTGLAYSLRGMGTGAQEPLHSHLATLTMPALIMAGELDHKFAEIGREMAAVMPDARFQAITGAGHAAQAEHPAECAALVTRFITSLEPTGEN